MIDEPSRRATALKVNELNPDAGSGDEIEAIKANKNNKGPQAPDVIDVGLSFGPSAKAEGLLQPTTRPSTWDSIPAELKDADGAWIGDYYGVLAFEVNKDLVKKIADRLGRTCWRRNTRAAVALTGDPRTANQAILAVYAAGLSAGGKSAGRDRRGRAAVLRRNEQARQLRARHRQGRARWRRAATPIVLRWDYNALADRDTLKGNPPVGDRGAEDRALSPASMCRRSAPSRRIRTRRKLWIEYLYSDEGQIDWLKGYCHPVRFNSHGRRQARFRPMCSPSCRRPTPMPRPVFPIARGPGRRRRHRDRQASWDTVVGANVK
jgi:putative spermidine/putrescine transport system substrate-binding protein